MRNSSHDPKLRETAAEMYVHHGRSMQEISTALDIPYGTISRWKVQDHWQQDREDQASEPFAQTCNYLMRTIHRMSERLFQSTIPPDGSPDFVLPDENLELRINRLTLAVERILPMGNLLLNKQRVDVVREIKEYAFDAVAKKSLEEHQVFEALKVFEGYLKSLEIRPKAA